MINDDLIPEQQLLKNRDGGGPAPLWNHWFWNWVRKNGRALQAVFYHLPRYLWGDWNVHRQHLKRTSPHFLFFRCQWVGIERWRAPSLHAAVMDGMGEHYGYPRHHAYLLLWWNRKGYALGVEFSFVGTTPLLMGGGTKALILTENQSPSHPASCSTS